MVHSAKSRDYRLGDWYIFATPETFGTKNNTFTRVIQHTVTPFIKEIKALQKKELDLMYQFFLF